MEIPRGQWLINFLINVIFSCPLSDNNNIPIVKQLKDRDTLIEQSPCYELLKRYRRTRKMFDNVLEKFNIMSEKRNRKKKSK